MIQDKNLKKHQQMFLKMSPAMLDAYCEQHTSYSLPAGIRNARTKEALEVMQNCAQELPIHTRKILAVYIQETFRHGDVKTKPALLNAIYAPLLNSMDFEKEPLKKAINEFLGFANTPMTRERQELIQRFIGDLTGAKENTPSSAEFTDEMDRYYSAKAYSPQR